VRTGFPVLWKLGRRRAVYGFRGPDFSVDLGFLLHFGRMFGGLRGSVQPEYVGRCETVEFGWFWRLESQPAADWRGFWCFLDRGVFRSDWET